MKFAVALAFVLGIQSTASLSFSHESGKFGMKHMVCYKNDDCQKK